jgi:hypothetical protein
MPLNDCGTHEGAVSVWQISTATNRAGDSVADWCVTREPFEAIQLTRLKSRDFYSRIRASAPSLQLRKVVAAAILYEWQRA